MAEVKQVAKDFVNPISWVRTAIAILMAFFIYRAMTKPTQNIVAKKGSTVQVTQVNKTAKFLIPFVEAYVSQESDNKMNTGIRGGVRIEF